MTISLSATTRTQMGSQVEALRAQGLVPGVIYGHKLENRFVTLNQSELLKAYKQGGESTLIDLSIDGKEPIEVLIKEIQVVPLKDTLSHVDFYQVKKGEKIETEIELRFVGESPAVKALGGTLVKALDEISIKCLPRDLVQYIDIDISVLKDFNDSIHVEDLKVPAGIEIVTEGEIMVAMVSEPKEEKVEATAKTEEAQVEAVGASAEKGKKEAEGADTKKEPAKK